jgi:hypothetical protein
MAGMGPAPKPAAERRRRNATVAMMKLPAGGWQGVEPEWPLLADITMTERLSTAQRVADDLELQLAEPDLSARERASLKRKLDTAQTEANILNAQLEAGARVEAELWTALWTTPQAAAWERLGWTREVAQYVRWKARAEQGNLDASKEARQLADRLGLNPLAMLRLRWEVAEDEVGVQRAERTTAAMQSTRRRLKVVDPDVAGA